MSRSAALSAHLRQLAAVAREQNSPAALADTIAAGLEAIADYTEAPAEPPVPIAGNGEAGHDPAADSLARYQLALSQPANA